MPRQGDALMAEAMSCQEALSWLKQQGLDNIILELEALNVVNALNNNIPMLSPIGLILFDCTHLMSFFNNLRLLYVNGSVNRVAHLLAKAVESSTCRGIWTRFCLSLIRDIIAYDLI